MLRERTQRRLFRGLFIVGCVLPTLAVAVYAVNRVTPVYRTALLDELSQRLGCRVECEHLTTPRPGVYELSGVRLRDAASKHERLALAQARLTKQHGRWRVAGSEARCPSVTDAGLVLTKLAEAGFDTEVRLERVTIGTADALTGVTLSLSETPEALRQLSITDRAGRRLRAVLNQDTWRLDAETGDRPIPASWLPGEPLVTGSAQRFDFVGSLGAECSRDGHSIRGVAAGRFDIDRLDLRQLLAERGALTEVDLRWTHQRIERLSGRLTLRDGQLSRSFTEGAATWLKLKPYDRLRSLYNDPSEPLAWFPFSQVACEIDLGAEGLVLVARNDRIDGENRSGQVAHAIVEHNGQPLLGEPESPRLSVQSLVQAWFADQAVELPASSEAIEMARRLPQASTR